MLLTFHEPDLDAVEVHLALEKLSAEFPRHAEVVELMFFGGLNAAEASDVMSASGTDVSKRTVERDWLSSGKPIAELLTQNHNIIWGIAFSPDGRYLAAAEGGLQDLEIATGHLVTIWDLAMRRVAATLTSHTQDVRAVAFSPDGRTLCGGQLHDSTIKVWEAGSFREVATLKSHKVQSVAFWADGQRLVSGGQDKTLKIWNLTTLQQVGSLSLPSVVNSVAVSPHEQLLAAGSDDGKIRE